jgi:predicted nucleic acid-binding protein
MSERFLIEPFDARDAILAAELWNEGKSTREMKTRGSRVCLRADALIVATAKNHGATEFFTEDNDCFNMASKVMVAKRLPTIAPDLFA